MGSINPAEMASRLADMPTCRFPRLIPLAEEKVVSRRPVASTRVTTDQQDKLRELAAADPDSLAAVLATAWALLLRCYTGEDHVSFGIEHAGDVSRRPLVARFPLDNSASVAETLARAKTEIAGNPGLAPQPIPTPGADRHDTALVLWGFSKSASTTSHVPSLVNSFLSQPLAGLLHWLTTNQQQQQHTRLRFLAKQGSAGLSLFLEWSTTLLGGVSSPQGTLVASTLGQILSSLVAARPEASLAELEYVSPATLKQVRAWNDRVSLEPVERRIHDVIADRVQEQPDAEAICAWDGSFTYAELDAVTSRLAARLVQLGVGPEVLVPLCFSKSVCTCHRLVPSPLMPSSNGCCPCYTYLCPRENMQSCS